MRSGGGFRTVLILMLIAGSNQPAHAAAPAYANGVALGTVTAGEISEASGIVASRQNPGVLWTHNDTGYPGSVFALSTNGNLLARYYVPNTFYGDGPVGYTDYPFLETVSPASNH